MGTKDNDTIRLRYEVTRHPDGRWTANAMRLECGHFVLRGSGLGHTAEEAMAAAKYAADVAAGAQEAEA